MRKISSKFFYKYFLMSHLVLINLLYSVTYADPGHSHHWSPENQSERKPASIHLRIEKIQDKGDKKLVIFKLTDVKNGQAIGLNDLAEVHTQKIHLLIIDDSLTDYSHVHPKAIEKLGAYEFEWKPHRPNAHYRLWVDLLPKKTKTQEFIIADLTLNKSKDTIVKIESKPTYESIVNNYKFQLSFDKSTLEVGKAAMGKITVSDIQGRAVKNLEPVMGAFAHIVGFNDDLRTIVHIHPMGKEPKSSAERGGPELLFHLQPEKAGFVKVFAQVRLDGREIFVPFGIRVNAG